MRADGAGEGQLLLGDVEGDDPGRGHGPQQLDGDVAEPARADDDGGAAGDELRQGPLDGVVRGEARVRERRGPHGVEVAERDEVAGLSTTMYSAMAPGAPRPGGLMPSSAARGQ